MRADGSFPLSAQLSACSAIYSDADLQALVSIAEMAAAQGYDVYPMSFGGTNLDTAINFLLDSYENTNLLWQYSKAGGGICYEGNPGDPPDFSFFQDSHGLAVLDGALYCTFPAFHYGGASPQDHRRKYQCGAVPANGRPDWIEYHGGLSQTLRVPTV